MNELEAKILPYYFFALMGFIILNMLMSLCLYSFTKIKNIKLLSWYWLSLLLAFAFQGQFQYGELPIILSYASSIVPSILISMIIFDTMSKKASVQFYFTLWLVAFAAAPLLHYFKFSFFWTSLPLSLAMGFIPLHTAFRLLQQDSIQATFLQKFMGVIMVITFIHFINFSIFRLSPGNQLWGHALSLALYQIYSVSIFALVLEGRSRQEKVRLTELVDIRTSELKSALKVKETLFRMVLHDIATPIQGQMWAIQLLQKNKEHKIDILKKLSDMTNMIKNVIDQVRTIEAIGSGKIAIDPSPVNLDDCLNDIWTMFNSQLEKKNLVLKIENKLPQETVFYADHNVFTTSVLGNLISNAIKFSPNDSTLRLHSFERNNKVIIELEDNGIGIPQDLVFAMFDPVKKSNRQGTNGESGTGFGMVQVKSYIDHFGGKIDVESRPMETFPMNHGTKITLTMDKSLSNFH